VAEQMIHIQFEPAEGAILRLIGLVERRGYDVSSIQLASSKQGRMDLELGLNPRQLSNNIHTLKRQIHRLTGVSTVEDRAAISVSNKGVSNGQ